MSQDKYSQLYKTTIDYTRWFR